MWPLIQSNNTAISSASADPVVETGKILREINYKLSAIPGGQAAKQQVMDALVVNLANAAGVTMHGRTLYDTSPQPHGEVKDIANQLGTQAMLERNRMYIAPYERSRPTGQAITIRMHEGEPEVLMVKHAGNTPRSNDWYFPAGFMDLPPASEVSYTSRLSHEQQSPRDQAQARGEATPLPNGQQFQPVYKELQPPQEALRLATKEIQDEAYKQGGWRALADLYDNPVAAREGLALQQAEIKGAYDLTPRAGMLRELREETGRDYSSLPADKITRLDVNCGLIHSRGRRPLITNFVYLVDAGEKDIPVTSPLDPEIAETQWVKVSALAPNANGLQTPQGVTVIPETAVMLEKAMQAWTEKRLKQESNGVIESIGGLASLTRSHAGKHLLRCNGVDPQQLHTLSALSAVEVDAQNRVDTLIGAKGAALQKEMFYLASKLGVNGCEQAASASAAR